MDYIFTFKMTESDSLNLGVEGVQQLYTETQIAPQDIYPQDATQLFDCLPHVTYSHRISDFRLEIQPIDLNERRPRKARMITFIVTFSPKAEEKMEVPEADEYYYVCKDIAYRMYLSLTGRKWYSHTYKTEGNSTFVNFDQLSNLV